MLLLRKQEKQQQQKNPVCFCMLLPHFVWWLAGALGVVDLKMAMTFHISPSRGGCSMSAELEEV